MKPSHAVRKGGFAMKRPVHFLLAIVLIIVPVSLVQAEILALLNYESKPEQKPRKEGIAVIDVDPTSSTFGKMLMDIPLPTDLVTHHIYYNRDMSKAYITALGKSVQSSISEHESIQFIRQAIDRGITFMDNCWDYNEGASQVRMGKALKDGYRQKVFLMDKIDGRTFKPLTQAEVTSLLKRTRSAALEGKYELYKTSTRFDGTQRHPEWLGEDPLAG
jgi:hypothetical protein